MRRKKLKAGEVYWLLFEEDNACTTLMIGPAGFTDEQFRAVKAEVEEIWKPYEFDESLVLPSFRDLLVRDHGFRWYGRQYEHFEYLNIYGVLGPVLAWTE